ncbi:group III truncated hemoglobin [Maritalea sp.]|jgi:hemoglobin|uniref:group III truncated hemoglobin n=1 Tax=Maritalea sp. TaxID=2003361 RepID=UPI0039E4E763
MSNSFAETHRENYRREANGFGIDEAFISVLVESFYKKVRTDKDLGPIFDAIIGDNWPPHLAKMKQFWGSIALKTGEYHGRPMPVHMKLKHVERWHFERWLELFAQNLDEIAPSPEAKSFFNARARNIAKSLMSGMFYDPAADAAGSMR